MPSRQGWQTSRKAALRWSLLIFLAQTLKHERVSLEVDQAPQWSAVETLTAKTPLADDIYQLPTLVWTVLVSRVAAMVILNRLLPAKDVPNATNHALLTKIEELEQRLNASIHHYRAKSKAPQSVGEVPLELEERPCRVDNIEDLSKEIQELFEAIKTQQLGQFGLQMPTPPADPGPDTPPLSIQAYRDLFRVIDLPAVAENFETDETFARYRVAGPNPMVIEGVTKRELDDLIGHRITDQDLNDILNTHGDSLERAGREGRLCVANYKSLSTTDPVAVIGNSFVTTPIAVFAEPLSGSQFIKPVAVQLGQDSVKSELLLANTPDIYRWQMAKTIVQVADAVHHELIAHLADTHLMMEAFSVATQRNLPEEHPLHKLLAPHFDGTNFINNQAANILILTGGQIDSAFANGQPARLRSLQALAVGARFEFDFENMMPDVELKARKVDKLKIFPYRDDALLIWDAILSWASQYIDLYYPDDDAVKFDAELAQWSEDLGANAHVKNFKAPQTKAVLVRTVAMIMFTTSAQHAAVNFPQQSDMTFAPAMAGHVFNEMPPVEAGHATEKQWLGLMPSIRAAMGQLGLLYILGGVYYRRLGEYHSRDFPYFGTLDRKAAEALDAFRQELDAVETIITRRNKHRGAFAYTHLLPSNIPASINI